MDANLSHDKNADEPGKDVRTQGLHYFGRVEEFRKGLFQLSHGCKGFNRQQSG